MIQRVQGRGAGEENLPHVGDVEQARLLADGHVLLDNAGSILHRQQVASEGDHLAALCHMDIIEWGFRSIVFAPFPSHVPVAVFKNGGTASGPMPNTVPP